jgi:REP element-mobilizing transposase RayT
MLLYRRRLPHGFLERSIIFVTWRLAGTLPACAEGSADGGPFWLRDERVAKIVQDALEWGAAVRQSYDLYAWAIMPNHVHAVLEPHAPMPEIMRWLKGRTGRIINRELGRCGQAFWQDESYDHWIRSTEELNEVIRYVESNPVRAGLAKAEDEWIWSSAACRADHEKRWSAPQ